jgi:hypothetical protein
MGLATSPGIVTNGLVFYYDMYNTLKSFKGAPTTNQVSNATAFSGWSNYWRTDYINSFTTEFGTTGYRITGNPSWNGLYRGISIPSTGNYTFSAWFRYWGGTSNNNGAQVYISGWGGGDSASGLDKSKVGIWQRVAHTLNCTNTSMTFYLISYGGDSTGRADCSTWDVTMPQVESGSTVSGFVDGTRSSTQALIDLSGQNTITASSLTYASDNTFSFNGNNNNFIDGGNNTGVLNITHPTICVWVRRTSYNSSFPMIIRRNDRDAYSLQVGQSNDTIWFKIYHGSSSWTSTPTSTIPLNTWCHFCGVFNGTQVLLYKNGQLAQSANITSPISYGEASTPQLIIGRDDAVSGRYWHGNIPNVQIYNRPLSAAEIQQNFNAQRGIYGI